MRVMFVKLDEQHTDLVESMLRIIEDINTDISKEGNSTSQDRHIEPTVVQNFDDAARIRPRPEIVFAMGSHKTEEVELFKQKHPRMRVVHVHSDSPPGVLHVNAMWLTRGVMHSLIRG